MNNLGCRGVCDDEGRPEGRRGGEAFVDGVARSPSSSLMGRARGLG